MATDGNSKVSFQRLIDRSFIFYVYIYIYFKRRKCSINRYIRILIFFFSSFTGLELSFSFFIFIFFFVATTKCAAEKGYVEEYVDSGQCGPINEIKRYKETTAVVRYCAPANQGCTFLHCSFFALLSRIIARELPENPLESIICNEKTQKRKISKFKDHPSSHPQC